MGILDKIKTIGGRARKAAAEFEEAVDGLRTRLGELRDERERVAGSPLSKPEIEANVDAILDSLEQEARGWLVPSAFMMPADQYRSKPSLDALQRHAPLGALVLLGGRDTVRAALLSAIMTEAKEAGTNPLSAVEREAELARIEGEIDITERAEEELIRAAEDVGVRIWRRADARPEIFLAETV